MSVVVRGGAGQRDRRRPERLTMPGLTAAARGRWPASHVRPAGAASPPQCAGGGPHPGGAVREHPARDPADLARRSVGDAARRRAQRARPRRRSPATSACGPSSSSTCRSPRRSAAPPSSRSAQLLGASEVIAGVVPGERRRAGGRSAQHPHRGRPAAAAGHRARRRSRTSSRSTTGSRAALSAGAARTRPRDAAAAAGRVRELHQGAAGRERGDPGDLPRIRDRRVPRASIRRGWRSGMSERAGRSRRRARRGQAGAPGLAASPRARSCAPASRCSRSKDYPAPPRRSRGCSIRRS